MNYLIRMTSTTIAPGITLTPGYLDRAAQEALLAAVRDVIAAAPLYTPRMPRSGKPMSVKMTNCGALGWVTDEARGYRYQATHPETEAPWPPIPDGIMRAWACIRTRTSRILPRRWFHSRSVTRRCFASAA